MTKRLFLTNAHYIPATDEFVCQIIAEGDDDQGMICGTLGVSHAGKNATCSLDSCVVAIEFVIENYPVTNTLHLAALATMALHNAMGPDDETYADVLARGDVTVLEA